MKEKFLLSWEKDSKKGFIYFLIHNWIYKAVLLGSIYPFIFIVIKGLWFSSDKKIWTVKQFILNTLISTGAFVIIFGIAGAIHWLIGSLVYRKINKKENYANKNNSES